MEKDLERIKKRKEFGFKSNYDEQKYRKFVSRVASGFGDFDDEYYMTCPLEEICSKNKKG